MSEPNIQTKELSWTPVPGTLLAPAADHPSSLCASSDWTKATMLQRAPARAVRWQPSLEGNFLCRNVEQQKSLVRHLCVDIVIILAITSMAPLQV